MNLTQALLITTSIFAACTDLKTGRIPNALTYCSTIGVVLIAFCESSLRIALTGMVATTLPLLILYACTAGRGLGLGDVKLAGCIGAALGWSLGLQVIGLAFIVGACVAVLGLMSGWFQRKSRIAFAPYLALASCYEVFCSPGIGWSG